MAGDGAQRAAQALADSGIAHTITRHGPVVWADNAKDRAFAVRTIWNEPGSAGYYGSSRLWRAKDWAGFQAARDRWAAPPQNLIYADASGEIGWAPGGRTPVRPNWDGLFPVPGDGRYEWAGFVEDGGLPVSRNPREGFFATANEMNLPADWPHGEHPVGFEWTEGSRARRISEVLATPGDVAFELGLTRVVSPLRLSGMTGMLGRIKRQVREAAA